MKSVNLEGLRFGRLIVRLRSGKTRGGNYIWRCQCDCGEVCDVASARLRSSLVKSCGCGHASYLRDRTRGIKSGTAFRKLLGKYQRSAESRGIAWQLTDEQFRDIIIRPCFYTGRQPSATSTAVSGEIFTYSGLDRLDSNLGYTVENCVACCADANYAKRSLSYEAFLQLVKEVYQCRIS